MLTLLFFKIFDFPFVKGNIRTALSQPKSVVLSKETAAQLFNHLDPIGKTIDIGDEGSFIVSGVFDDSKFPTHLSIDALRLTRKSNNDVNLWKASYTYVYVKTVPASNISSLERKLTSLYQQGIDKNYGETGSSKQPSKLTVNLQPLSGIYLYSKTEEEIGKNGSETSVWLIACLSVFMLWVSAINFTNLSLSEAPSKAKEIAVKRYLGASKLSILKLLYFEIALKCLFALFIAFILVLLILPSFSSFTSIQFHLFTKSNAVLWLQISAILLIVILIGGTYPVLYLSYIQPVVVLKGNFIHNTKGNTIRNILLVLQYTLTSIFIIGVIIISKQVTFLRDKDLGFNPEQVLILHSAQFQTQYNYESIKNSLLEIPGIKYVSYASAIGQSNEKTVMHLTVNGQDNTAQYVCVDSSYFNLIGAHIISGKNFSSLSNDSANAIIINETLANKLNITDINNLSNVKAFDKNVTISGIVNDINFYGFEKDIAPMAFMTNIRTLVPYVLVKLRTNHLTTTVNEIKSLWKTIEPGYPLRYTFLDQSFENVYSNYDKLNKIFRFFTACAFIIALIGLFALSAIITNQRYKEIAIRKVLGASAKNILILLNNNFVKLSLLANILASPLAYLLVQQWLNNFAYRIEITAFPFFIATAVSVAATLLTVSIQGIKAVLVNPVSALKQE